MVVKHCLCKQQSNCCKDVWEQKRREVLLYFKGDWLHGAEEIPYEPPTVVKAVWAFAEQVWISGTVHWSLLPVAWIPAYQHQLLYTTAGLDEGSGMYTRVQTHFTISGPFFSPHESGSHSNSRRVLAIEGLCRKTFFYAYCVWLQKCAFHLQSEQAGAECTLLLSTRYAEFGSWNCSRLHIPGPLAYTARACFYLRFLFFK